MKRLCYALLFCSLCIFSINCQKEISYTGHGIPDPGNNNPAPVKATIQGNVLDENGNPAVDVMIKVGNKNSTTDSKGYFRITDAALDKNASLVVAEKMGYFKAYRSFNATTGANYVKIKLVKKISAGTINAATGGNVLLTNGTRIELPANGVIKASGGSAYSGNIIVYVSYIDPTADDISLVVPGSFMADSKDNKRVILESYGMLAVELESSAGEKLQLSSGAAATITSPIPASLQASAPASIALWYVNEQTGIWKEEGNAVKDGDSYVGTVKHFSFWNCDIGIPTVRLSATLKDSKGIPIEYGLVRIKRLAANSSSQAYAWSDSLGQVSGLVPANESLVFELLDPCHNTAYTQNVSSLSKNIDLGTIEVSNVSPSLVTIEGLVKDCSNIPVTHGYTIVSYDNTSRYVSVNDQGEFMLSFLRCASGSSGFEIFGVNEATQEQSAPVTISFAAQNTHTGDILACGNSATQYINYRFDGVDYSISSLAGDSLSSFTYQTQSTPSLFTWMGGLETGSDNNIALSFIHDSAPGSYLLDKLSLQNFDSVLLVQPSNVILVKYPPVVGEFFEGSFSGQFKGASPSVIHNVSGSFRIRRF